MKFIEVVADVRHVDVVTDIAERHEVTDLRLGFKAEDGRQAMRMLVSDDKVQLVLDALQMALEHQEAAFVTVIPVEAVLPRPTKEERKEEDTATASRESLYYGIEKGARLDGNFVVLVVLSTIVATIGLLEDNVAVVIGAMVIAPLLGPNLALGLGTALGDLELMGRAVRTNLAGLGLCLVLSVLISLVWPIDMGSHELMARTDVGFDSVALALASGAAAVLSMTTGLPSVLVGVMVAVALLPPAATLGIMLGSGHLHLALGAGLLLAVNIVSVNLAAKLVFLVKGIRPRTWWQKEKARQSMAIYLVIWVFSLLILLAAIYVWQGVPAVLS